MNNSYSKKLLAVAAATATLGAAAMYADEVNWTGAIDSDFMNDGNWSKAPVEGDYSQIVSDDSIVELSSGESVNLNAVRVQSGVLNITGGTLNANASSAWDTLIASGSAGAGLTAAINQGGGIANINYLEIGAATGADGSYNLTAGEFNVTGSKNENSLWIARPYRGIAGDANLGSVTVSGGALNTRDGVVLGSDMGNGTFSVVGSAATEINIGSLGTLDGSWVQDGPSDAVGDIAATTGVGTLKVAVDDGGLTKILIDDTGTGDANATFEAGSILDVGFADGVTAVEGTWVVMEVEGAITDNGLTLPAEDVTAGWSFAFSDTGANGTTQGEGMDTLSITYGMAVVSSDFDDDGEPNDTDERQEFDGADLVVDYSSGSENEFWNTIRLHQGTINVTGGLLQAQKSDLWDCWVGTVSGGTGTFNQSGGDVILNFLEIARSAGSTGVYNLSGGTLLLPELSRKPVYNLFIGGNDGGVGANGTFEVSGGSLTTRAGVELVSPEAVFSVVGSGATSISIGGHDREPTPAVPAIPATDTEPEVPAVDEVVYPKVDGAWSQAAGATLKLAVAADGITPIVIEDSDESGDGANVEFAAGAILDVSFVDGAEANGTWTVMEFAGTVTDNGLAFADSVSDDWSFAFDEGVSPKVLTVTYSGLEEKVNLALGGTATASTEGYDSTAASAIDGNTNPVFSPTTMFHSLGGTDDPTPWWQVELAESASIGDIVFYMRGESHPQRNTFFNVVVLDADGNEVFLQEFTTPQVNSFTVDAGGVTGKTIRYEKNDSEPAVLAEVEVYAYDPDSVVDTDNDGVIDSEDAFPEDETEQYDFDEDGTGDNADTDDDNDTVLDEDDAFPFDAAESKDSDNDGTGDNEDTDDDNDGILDVDEVASKLINISTRGYVLDGNKVMIAGFVVEGTDPVSVLIQGVGPELDDSPHFIEDSLLDPNLGLYDVSGALILENDDWGSEDATAIVDASDDIGSFVLEVGSKSSAILTTLDAGIYTVILNSKDGVGGVGLLEVYEIPAE